MVDIGVIGTGGIAGVHLTNLKKIKGVRIKALCDVSRAVLNSRLELFGGKGYSDYHEMLDKEHLDGVLLCTPARVRLEPIRACVKKGLPLFIEKPVAANLKEGRKIAQLFQSNPCPHIVGFVFRWATFIEKVMEKIAGRQIYGIQSHYFCDMMFPEARQRCASSYYNKAESGGMIGDQALHILDLIRYLTGSEAGVVYANGNNFLCPKTERITTEETVAIQMQLKNGVVANHLHSWAFPRWEIEMAVFGENFDLKILLGENQAIGRVDGRPFEAKQDKQLHQPIMKAFVDLIRSGDGKYIKSDVADAMKTQELTAAVDRSLSKGIVRL